jgi:hypothetical protein
VLVALLIAGEVAVAFCGVVAADPDELFAGGLQTEQGVYPFSFALATVVSIRLLLR